MWLPHKVYLFRTRNDVYFDIGKHLPELINHWIAGSTEAAFREQVDFAIDVRVANAIEVHALSRGEGAQLICKFRLQITRQTLQHCEFRIRITKLLSNFCRSWGKDCWIILCKGLK